MERSWFRKQKFSRHRSREFEIFQTNVLPTNADYAELRRGRVLVSRSDRQTRTSAHILQLTRMTCRAELVPTRCWTDVPTEVAAFHSSPPNPSNHPP